MAKSSTPDDPNEVPKDPKGWASRWGKEFAAAKRWHREWIKDGDKAYQAYLAKNGGQGDEAARVGFTLNLFSSNINTVQSMLFGQIPEVSADRRWADPDDTVARVASVATQRMLNMDLQESGDDYCSVMRSVLQDRLIPGVGIARVRYDYKSHTEKKAAIMRGVAMGAPIEAAPATEKEVIDDEWVDEEYVHWKDALWSPCRYWSEMRWIAFRTYMGRPELKDRFGAKIGNDVPLNAKSPLEESTGSSTSNTGEIFSKAEVWEIWDKEHRQVFWYVDGHERVLDQKADFLKLDNFFPVPPFFIANVSTIEYLPTSDWKLARSLYREIDLLEERISLLTSAIKVIGTYDRKQQDVQKLVNETAENKLIPVDNWAMFAEKGGIKGAVDWFPVDTIVQAVQVLQQQQQARIAQLYQITGMSDIVRGESGGGPQPASATEQGIKAKFASVRLQSIQDDFARFATDLQKLKFEIISKVFQPATIIAKSNIMNAPEAKNDNGPQIIEAAIKLIKDERTVHWRIAIKPESMALTDYAQLQSTRTEYLKSLGFFVQSIEPFAEKFPIAMPMLTRLMQWGLAGFKGANEIQGVVDQGIQQMEKQLQQQQGQPQNNPQAAAESAKQQTIQAQGKLSAQQHEQKMAEIQAEGGVEANQAKLNTAGKIAETEAASRLQHVKNVGQTMKAPAVPQLLQDPVQQPAPPQQPQEPWSGIPGVPR